MNIKLKAAALTVAGLSSMIAATLIVKAVFTVFTANQIGFALGAVSMVFAIYAVYRIVLNELECREALKNLG